MTRNNRKLMVRTSRAAVENMKRFESAYANLENHREGECPICSAPGHSINVIRTGVCTQGRALVAVLDAVKP